MYLKTYLAVFGVDGGIGGSYCAMFMVVSMLKISGTMCVCGIINYPICLVCTDIHALEHCYSTLVHLICHEYCPIFI